MHQCGHRFCTPGLNGPGVASIAAASHCAAALPRTTPAARAILAPVARNMRVTRCLFRPNDPPLSKTWPTMTRTAEVPARGPLSDILRKATHVEPQPEPLPPSAKFLYGAIAQNLFARLKVSEPRRRRIAPCFALHDLPLRCVRHAVKMLANVGRVGNPVPFRNVLSEAPFPRPMPNRLHTRVSRARWGVRRCADLGWPPINLVCREGIHGGIRVPSRNPLLGAPSDSQCRTAAF